MSKRGEREIAVQVVDANGQLVIQVELTKEDGATGVFYMDQKCTKKLAAKLIECLADCDQYELTGGGAIQ